MIVPLNVIRIKPFNLKHIKPINSLAVTTVMFFGILALLRQRQEDLSNGKRFILCLVQITYATKLLNKKPLKHW